MFNSEQKFVVNGDEKEDLKKVLELAFKLYGDFSSDKDTGVEGFKIDKKQGFIFAWMPDDKGSEYKGYTRYPMTISLDVATELVWEYLKSKDAKKIYDSISYPDNDGITNRGWCVFAPLWYGEYEVKNHDYAIIGIKPEYIVYGK